MRAHQTLRGFSWNMYSYHYQWASNCHFSTIFSPPDSLYILISCKGCHEEPVLLHVAAVGQTTLNPLELVKLHIKAKHASSLGHQLISVAHISKLSFYSNIPYSNICLMLWFRKKRIMAWHAQNHCLIPVHYPQVKSCSASCETK